MNPRNFRALRYVEALFVIAILVALGGVLSTASAQSLQFGTSVTSGDGVVSTTLNWSAPGASTCTASSTPATSFAGLRDATGSEAVAAIAFSTVFRMSCVWPGDRRVTLSWTPPAENTNGTPLTDLAGYDVFYGKCPQTPTPVEQISLDNPSVNSHVIEDLQPGEYCFWVVAVNEAGRYSENSNIATKTIAADANATESIEIQVYPVPAAVSGLSAN